MLCDTAGVGREGDHTTHGFTLRASPAVKHSVSPPGTVGPLTAAGLIPQHIKTQKSAPNNSPTHIEKTVRHRRLLLHPCAITTATHRMKSVHYLLHHCHSPVPLTPQQNITNLRLQRRRTMLNRG